jgi:hypothetical protein
MGAFEVTWRVIDQGSPTFTLVRLTPRESSPSLLNRIPGKEGFAPSILRPLMAHTMACLREFLTQHA